MEEPSSFIKKEVVFPIELSSRIRINVILTRARMEVSLYVGKHLVVNSVMRSRTSS